MTKFNRVANLDIRLTNSTFTGYIGSLNISNLRIAFQILKSLSWSTNTASIQIYNISPSKRAQIKDYGDEVTINAGYSEDTGAQLLFVGDTTKVTHIFDQPDIITSLQCGDGERILNQKLISVSYAERISARTVIEQIAEKMGVNVAFFAPSSDLVYEQGFQGTDLAKNVLDKVTKYLGLTWSIQNKNLYILQENGSTTKPPAVISQNTGMIGVPERYTYKRRDLFRAGPKQGYKVKTLLRPEILPGDKVNIISQQINLDDVFFVDSVVHKGDTYGSVWESEWECIRI